MSSFNDITKKTFENTVEKGENAGNSIFSFFHYVFKPNKTNCIVLLTFHLSSATTDSLDESKDLQFGQKFKEKS